MMHCPRLLSFSRDILFVSLHLLLVNPGMLLSRHQVVLLSPRKQFASVSPGRNYSFESERRKKGLAKSSRVRRLSRVLLAHVTT